MELQNITTHRNVLLRTLDSPHMATSRADNNRSKVTNGPAGVCSASEEAEAVASVTRAVYKMYMFFRVYIQHLSCAVLTMMAAIMACALRGDVMLIAHLSYKSFSTTTTTEHNSTTDNQTQLHSDTTLLQNTTRQETLLPDFLQLPDSYNLPDLLYYVAISVVSSEVTYHLMCGFLQVYFYILKRGEPEKWKCQPHRFLTRSNETHEIVVGTVNLIYAGAISGFLTCWIKSGNHNTVYYKIDEYGYWYLLASLVGLFLWVEATAYYIHAMLHLPFFYKTLHKHHHRYHSPTAYSAVSMSPIELTFLNVAIIVPLFLVPINGIVFVAVVVYIYYFGLMDHSGIMMESWFPWQPHTKFHDDHHRYFHCNFGFNTYLFDRLHGTLRKKDRQYGETIFGGRGKKKE